MYDIIDVEDYEFEDKLPKESLVFMMLATYGDGEPTTSAAAFFEWLTTLGDKPSGNSTLEVQGVLSIKRNSAHHILTEGCNSMEVCLQEDVTQIV